MLGFGHRMVMAEQLHEGIEALAAESLMQLLGLSHRNGELERVLAPEGSVPRPGLTYWDVEVAVLLQGADRWISLCRL